MITIEDFQKIELKIGKIITAEKVPDTDKLVKFEIDLGDEKRQIVGGFALAYSNLDKLVGTEVPVVTNLEPKMLRGFESHGMILAASADGLPVALHPDKEVEPGTNIR